jgi:hypothetical protein
VLQDTIIADNVFFRNTTVQREETGISREKYLHITQESIDE